MKGHFDFRRHEFPPSFEEVVIIRNVPAKHFFREQFMCKLLNPSFRRVSFCRRHIAQPVAWRVQGSGLDN
jgi:hypothetical protein